MSQEISPYRVIVIIFPSWTGHGLRISNPPALDTYSRPLPDKFNQGIIYVFRMRGTQEVGAALDSDQVCRFGVCEHFDLLLGIRHRVDDISRSLYNSSVSRSSHGSASDLRATT